MIFMLPLFNCYRQPLKTFPKSSFDDVSDYEIRLLYHGFQFVKEKRVFYAFVFIYPSAGHYITGNLNVIPDARVRNIISKDPKYRFPSNIDFSKCRREIVASLNDFSNRWCKRENVELDALKEWKINIFKIIDTRISFYSRNTHLFPLNLNILFVILNEVFRIFI